MQDSEFMNQLRGRLKLYPKVHDLIVSFGWNEEWLATPDKLQSETMGSEDIPPQDLAYHFLNHFSGLNCSPGIGWDGVQFGSGVAAAISPKVTQPYDVERYFLKESPPWSRPPAFPVGNLKGLRMLMRDDWTTITIDPSFRSAVLYNDPFACVADLMRGHLNAWPPLGPLIELDEDYILNNCPDYIQERFGMI
jgi:hypothetical protein